LGEIRKVKGLTELEYIAYKIGNPDAFANVEAIHAKSPNADLHTGNIAEETARQSGASLILSLISRDQMDLNRPRGRFNYPAVDEYRSIINEILVQKNLTDYNNKLKQPFLHISLHGMQNDWERDLEIGTGYGHYCSPSVKNWFVKKVAAVTDNYGVDDLFPGYTFRSVLRDGDLYSATDFIGFGPHYHAIQLEVSRTWRENHPEFLAAFLSNLVSTFQKEVVHQPSPIID
jgi:N-formylglutamate amidohydrolase